MSCFICSSCLNSSGSFKRWPHKMCSNLSFDVYGHCVAGIGFRYLCHVHSLRMLSPFLGTAHRKPSQLLQSTSKTNFPPSIQQWLGTVLQSGYTSSASLGCYTGGLSLEPRLSIPGSCEEKWAILLLLPYG